MNHHPPRRSWLTRLIPAAVAVVLASAAVWAGAANGWKVKPVAELTGRVAADDWCAEHGVAKSACVECDPSLFPRRPPVSWCAVHGVHVCPLCRPEAAEVASPPVVTAADRARAVVALVFADRAANHPRCSLHKRLIQLASADAVRRAGIEFAVAARGAVTETVDAPAETSFDPTRVARVAPRVAGVVWRVEKRAGDRVAVGDVLAVVESAEVGKAKAEFVHALSRVETAQKHLTVMRESFGAVEGLKLTEAQAAVEDAELRLIAARQALGNLGLNADAASTNLLAITAPLDGVVTACDAARGDRADPAKPLFAIADGRTLWLTLDVRLEDAARLAKGQTVRFRPDGGAEVEATLDWISTAADEKTRTVAARAAQLNADGRLPAHTFGAARVILRDEPAAVVVPSSAVHRDGNCTVVFVRDRDFEKPGAPKLFHVRSVRPGAVAGEVTEIVAGVLPGEVVAAAGSGALRAQLLKDSLGAG
jgi:cobalt-zinc-cadmium efflux system membrane fusion protein